jgi:RHS repeat-associated protein
MAGLDDQISTTRSGGTYYYLHDGLGVRDLIDGSQVVQNIYDTRGFGQDQGAQTSGVTNPFRYTGAYDDSWENALGPVYYMRHRYYLPNVGLFASRDAMNVDGGRGWTYVANGPINAVDPRGLWQLTFTIAMGWGIRVSIGNNGGSGLFDGQWSGSGHVGLGEGASLDLDVDDSGRHAPGVDPSIHAEGKCGLGPNVDAETDLGVGPHAENEWSLGYSLPGTPFSASLGNQGVTPTVGFGESAFIGGGAVIYQ